MTGRYSGQRTYTALTYRSKGVFTRLDVVDPTTVFTEAFGINSGGEMVRRYISSVGVVNGWVFTRTGYATLIFPGAVGGRNIA